jgi:hypothetical protein
MHNSITAMKQSNNWLYGSTALWCSVVAPPASEKLYSIIIKTEASLSAPFNTVQHPLASFNTV